MSGLSISRAADQGQAFPGGVLFARMVHPTCARIFLHDKPCPAEETKFVLGPFPLHVLELLE